MLIYELMFTDGASSDEDDDDDLMFSNMLPNVMINDVN